MDFEQLVRQTAQDLFDGTAVIFLGAGASMGNDSERAAGKGAPGSGDLTRAIAKRFDVDLKHDAGGNLLSTLRGVASLAVKKRDESTVKRFVIDQIRPRCNVPLRAHKALARLGPKIVMTTNYDNLYETAIREADKSLEKVVRSQQLPRLPEDRSRVLKLHGDLERADEIVLTKQDYRKWRREASGLKAEVVAALQKKICVFVGYSVGDENLQEILDIIEENLGPSAALKHFALVRDVDQELVAEWEGTVEFVQGDATSFFESLAKEYKALSPRPFDPGLERSKFERYLQSGDLTSAGEICKELADHLKAQGERAGAGWLWRAFGEAAQEAGEHGAAAAAWKEAGELFLASGYSLDAEPVLSAALSEAQAAGELVLEREIQPLLQRARLSAGEYDQVLWDAEQALKAYRDDASASLIYALRAVRAEARETTEGVDGAQEELKTALDELPNDALYFRVRAGADLARLFSEQFDWVGAHDVLNSIGVEILNGRGSHDLNELRRCEAIQKLARANVHFAIGEDAFAVTHYRECAPVLEELGELNFAVSALEGIVASAPFLGYSAGDDTTSRLRDLARSSDEHRKCTDLQRQGIESFAADELAAARNSLIQAEAAAKALHSPVKARRVRNWFAEVLLKAGSAKEALLQYAEVGDREKVEEVAISLKEEMPPRGGDSLPSIKRLIELAANGPLHSRGAALVALRRLWDVLPESSLPELADHLKSLPEMPNLVWAERNVLSDAADLARALAPRFSDDQAERVGKAVVSTIAKDDIFWTSHKAACLALASLASNHPSIIEKLSVPADRLAELVGDDAINDTVSALVALINLGLSGHAASKEKALEVLDGADTYSRVSWRQILGEASGEELASATRELLPQSVSRLTVTGSTTSWSMGAFSPVFLRDWDLPESVRAEVARTLSEAVMDQTVALSHRQAAALVLGYKAEQFDEGNRRGIVAALKVVLTRPFDAHPMLMSISDPLSMLRINMGQPKDVIGAAAEALLAFSSWIDDEEERRSLRREIERLRASQVETLGISIANGLANYTPKGSTEEKRWLLTRLLLLLNSQHPRVRQSAARSLATLVGCEVAAFDAELLDTILHLATADHVGDRVSAAHALSTMMETSSWSNALVTEALETLRNDTSYLVRHHAALNTA